ncbi:hypothetical protein V500_01463 [Pseudogymnoascus sp. VKM F-4518 (FW-2643)]|nr:hypothetical protein V500_01463 [Pseudogymnoascus sp. VKM F-4518 (FW-2643)]
MEITMMRRPVLLFLLSFLLYLALADLSSEGGLVKDEFPNPVPDYAFGLDGRSLGSRQRVCPTPGPGARLCDADTKCADGSCCSECGICGYGPTYCGEGNCTSSCEAVAMCGVYGDLTVNNGECGMGLCCSAYGWCGTTESHCVGTPDAPCQSEHGPCAIVAPKKCGVGSATTSKRTIAYYQAVSSYGRICNSIKPRNIDTTKFTHLYYAFASINPETYEITVTDKDKEIIPEFTVLNTTLKTWIAVGGFDFSEPDTPTHTTWSDLVSSSANRKTFITSLIDFMDFWGFSGADLDWEYPVDETRGGKKTDTANFVLLVKEMRERFGTKYGISMAIAPDYWYLRWFDLFSMQQYVDFFGFMTYDLHGFWDGLNANIGTTIRGQAGIDEIQNNTAPLYFDKLDFDKINFGLAYYGRGYTLANPTTCKELGCTFTGPSNPGKCTKQKGVMSLTEIQQLIDTEGFTPTLLGPQMMKSIQWADQWIGYDDDETFAMKKAWADDYCFGGTMAWSVDFYSGPGNGNTPPTTTDGTCGKDHDYTMCGNGFGSCCSSGGWCGDSDAHCGSGCQSESGECTQGGPTTDGSCGVGNNGLECDLFESGPCCSNSGFCGFGSSWCGVDDCQAGCGYFQLQEELGIKEVDRTQGPLVPDASCWDIKGVRDSQGTRLNRDIWEKTNSGGAFHEWYEDNFDSPQGWLEALANPLGWGQSHATCKIDTPCERPNCNGLENQQEAGTAWKYMTVISAVNMNQYFHSLWLAVGNANTRFAANDWKLSKTFWPVPKGTVLLDTLILNGLAAGLQAMLSLGGGAGAVAGALTGGAIYEAIAEIQMGGTAGDDGDHVVAFQQLTDVMSQGARTTFDKANAAIVAGNGSWPGARQVHDLFQDGSWVDYREIPVVSGSVSVTDVENAFFQLTVANLVNYAWRQQVVYLACYPMSQETFDNTEVKAGNNEDKLKIYISGIGCYFQSALPNKTPLNQATSNFDPPGWKELDSDDYPFSTHDIMISSLESWDRYGMGEEDRSRDENFWAHFGPGKDLKESFRSSGLFNLAVCIPETSDDPNAGWRNPNSDDTPTQVGIDTFFDSLHEDGSNSAYQKNERNKSLHEIYKDNDWDGAWSESCLSGPWGGGVK